MSAVADAPLVADLFLETARRLGDRPAIVRDAGGVARREATFAELAADVERLSGGLRRAGIAVGARVAVLVPPSRDLYACTFALFRIGAVPVFVDPGIGFANMGRCLEEAKPIAFVGSPKAHLARLIGRWAPSAKITIVADGKIPGLWNSRELRGMGGSGEFAGAGPAAEDTAAILFTSGSTGAPKGVIYTHAMFAAQVERLRALFAVKEGEISVPTFPLFGLFDAALGQTCVIPDMDFTRPGWVDPYKIVSILQRHGAHQLFGSPALLDRVGRCAQAHGLSLPTLRRVLSAGAPVHSKVLARFVGVLAPGVEIKTPYGATEALPVAVIGSEEILNETSAKTAEGAGVCVGRPVEGAAVDIIKIFDEAAPNWSDSLRQAPGRIGEIVVSGPMVSSSYDARPEADAISKMYDGKVVRHRMGDLGYFDSQGRLWFCGRKAHRVKTAEGELYSVPVEGIFNTHRAVRRTALVGVRGRPVLCVERELNPGLTEEQLTKELLALGQRHETTRPVKTILYHPNFPTDIRHNAKIFREKLACWAATQVKP